MRFLSNKKALAIGKHRASPAAIGVILSVAVLVIGIALFNKGRIVTALTPGDVVQINFARDYKLREFVSKVKVAGVPVGTVRSVDRQDDGTASVEVKIDPGVREKLGSQPTAAIRPTTLLGGFYYVELIPGGSGGEFEGAIPVERTHVAVELDRVVGALQPSALQGARSSIARLDETLARGGTTAIDQLLADAPASLEPAGEVLASARGTNPRSDLSHLVAGLESTSRALTRQDGQLDSIVRDLASTSTVLGNRSQDIADTLSQLPSTLESTNSGLSRLDTTLIKLKDTADPMKPVVRELNTTLEHADPVLTKARPLVRNLKDLLIDARPLVRDLVPASERTTQVMNNLREPVLDRVNGPIKTFLHSPYNGKGPYAGSGSNLPVYQEAGFLFATLLREATTSDRNGHVLNVHAGVGPGSVAGFPINLEQLISRLTQLQATNSKGGPR